MRPVRFKDDTGCCGCLFVVFMFWLILITAIGGYKLFMYVCNI